MLEKKDSAIEKLHPSTRELTAGFDPHLSVGSARPAVFRSSTYVFSTPEAAERAFNITAGRAQRGEHEQVDLIYSRFNHPNAIQDRRMSLITRFDPLVFRSKPCLADINQSAH